MANQRARSGGRLERDRSFIRRLGRQARRSEQTRQAVRQRGRGAKRLLSIAPGITPIPYVVRTYICTLHHPAARLRHSGARTTRPTPISPNLTHSSDGQGQWKRRPRPRPTLHAPSHGVCNRDAFRPQGTWVLLQPSACRPRHSSICNHVSAGPHADSIPLARRATGAGEKETTLAADRATAGVHVRPWQVHASPCKSWASPRQSMAFYHLPYAIGREGRCQKSN